MSEEEKVGGDVCTKKDKSEGDDLPLGLRATSERLLYMYEYLLFCMPCWEEMIERWVKGCLVLVADGRFLVVFESRFSR